MFYLFLAGIVGVAIGRAISLVLSQLFQQHVSLNIPNARTLIVLGSGGKIIIINIPHNFSNLLFRS